MMNQNNIKTFLAIIGLVLIGFLIGFFTNRYMTMQRIHTLSKLRKAQGFQQHLLKVIDASESQKAELKPIIQDFSGKMDQIHQEFRSKRHEIMDSLNVAIKGHLDPEQIDRFETFTRRFRGRSLRKQRSQNRNQNRQTKN